MAQDWLWAVNGDPNTHGGGGLIPANPQTVYINNIPVIEHGDPARPDGLCPAAPHCNPKTAEGSDSVFVYNNPVHRQKDKRICGATTVVVLQDDVFAGGGKQS